MGLHLGLCLDLDQDLELDSDPHLDLHFELNLDPHLDLPLELDSDPHLDRIWDMHLSQRMDVAFPPPALQAFRGSTEHHHPTRCSLLPAYPALGSLGTFRGRLGSAAV